MGWEGVELGVPGEQLGWEVGAGGSKGNARNLFPSWTLATKIGGNPKAYTEVVKNIFTSHLPFGCHLPRYRIQHILFWHGCLGAGGGR